MDETIVHDEMTLEEKLSRFEHLLEMLKRRPVGEVPNWDFTSEYFQLRKELKGF